MATTYTPNLRLRIEDDLTADAVYNLQRIDELGAVFKLNTAASVELSSAEDVILQPNNPAAGGSGVGGLIRMGSSSQPADLVNIYADEINFNNARLTGSYTIPWDRVDSSELDLSALTGLDTSISANSDVIASLSHITQINNPHSTTAAQVGAYTTSQVDALLSAKANLAVLELHTNASTGVHGLIGQVVGTTDVQSLVNKQIDAATNVITNLRDSAISEDAEINGNKINPNFGSKIIRSSGGLRLDGVSQYVTLLASAAFQSAPLTFRLPSSYGQSGQVLATDGLGNLSWQNSAGAAISQETYYWLDTDGTQFTISHSFNNKDLDITVRDTTDGELIYIPDINMVDNSTIILISSEAPSNAWQITIQGVAR